MAHHTTISDRAVRNALAAYEDWRRETIPASYASFTPRQPLPKRTAALQFQGRLVMLKVYGGGDRTGGGLRGDIQGFSAASRRRLLQLFARLKTGQKTVFITLTYPEQFPDAKEAKKNLRAFLERFRRRFKEVAGVWRLEFQKRGAPHFHLMFFSLPWIDKTEVQQMWGEIIGCERPFTRIEFVRSDRGVMSYVSKYMAKVTPSGSEAALSGFNPVAYLHAVGRYWGIFNRFALPFAPLEIVEEPNYSKAIFDFRRYARRYYPKGRKSPRFGFFLFVEAAPTWLRLFARSDYYASF